MSDITLSAGVRQNLLSLQSTASLLSTTQNDLATGKKVNSAADNPTNFFTSQSLNNRANDLSALLDSIGQAQQTVNQAESGITSLTNLVQSAKSLATQAQQATTGTVNYTAITGTQAIAADTTRVTSTATVASAVAGVTASVQSSATLDSTGLGNLSNGDTLTFQLGSGTTYTATFTTSGATGNSFTTAANLRTILTADFGSAATVSGTTGATVTSNDVSNDFTIGGTGAAHARSGNATDFQAVNHTLGDALTITDAAGHSANFYYVASNASAANGTFTTATDAVNAINNAASNVHANITASAPGGNLELDANNSITVAGNIGSALGINGTASANYNSTLAGITGNLTVQVAGNSAHTLTFGSANGQISTKAQLTTALSGLTDITGGFNSTNDIQFTPSSSAAVTIGGTPSTVTALGLSLGTSTPVGTVVTANATRTSLQNQYNDLLTQMDQLASDSSYNGINLLAGNNLKVTFNETGTSSLTIQGVNFSATGLGLTAVSGNGFQDNNNIANTITSLNTALTTLRTQAASFGSNLSTVQTRQDFTKDLINTLQTGANNLVLADTNQEGANLLALQTRQQLAITSLSLSSQSDQAILKIL
ncbi:MAG TPA: flagellar protein [Xanthobacteraceae bacterium]|nr:flagellar protein [Xanthobacteraceae bacterium]